MLQGAASRLSSRELATHLASWNYPSYSWTVPYPDVVDEVYEDDDEDMRGFFADEPEPAQAA